MTLDPDAELRRVLCETAELVAVEGAAAWAARFPHGVSDEVLAEVTPEGDAFLDAALGRHDASSG